MNELSSPLAALHPSNLLTYASLGAATAAIAAAGGGDAPRAGAWLALAVIFDTLDGKFARLFARTASDGAIGVQLDSLSDAIAFGMAPAIVAALLMESSPALWWLAAFVYAAGAITRLAFFNVTHQQTDGFVGLPVPVAALLWATAFLADPRPSASVLLAITTTLAMMLPLRIPRPRGPALAIFLCWPTAIILLST